MGLRGDLRLPGDKSIGHRALLLASLCPGISQIDNLPGNDDVRATRQCLSTLGVGFESLGEGCWRVDAPPRFTQPPEALATLDCLNSGTSMRLLTGLLCTQGLRVTLNGDAGLSRRPMGRIIAPLQQMGAHVSGADGDTRAPIAITPSPHGLHGIDYAMPTASAQVKSALLLAGLFAGGVTRVREPLPTRDHTERMLGYLGVPITRDAASGALCVTGGSPQRRFSPVDWQVPGDVSSAAFFIVAALLTPDSSLTIRDVGLNPGRTGLIEALNRVGAELALAPTRQACGEPVGDLHVVTRALSGDLVIAAHDVPGMIDELPVLAVAGLFLDGTLTVRGAAELRQKESDRIAALAQELAKLGVAMDTFDDGFCLTGDPQRRLSPPQTPLSAHGDHRIAMALRVLNRIASPQALWPLEGDAWANVSFPGFQQTLAALG